jgi:hypothetical protein
MRELHFSYSTLNMLQTYSHCWINKMLKVKQEDRSYFRAGHEGHKIIQDHVAGRKRDDRINYLVDTFPITEAVDFDTNCKFSIQVGGYEVIGYLDGDDPENKRFLEIKLSGSPWSMMKFQRAMQRKIYGLAKPNYTNSVLLTGSLDPNDWTRNKIKRYVVPITDKDREEAVAWIKSGIAIFENGDFNGGLDENGRCTDPGCPWGRNCHFKNI